MQQVQGVLTSYLRLGVLTSYLRLGVSASYLRLGVLTSYLRLGVLASYLRLGVLASYLRLGVSASYLRLGVSLLPETGCTAAVAAQDAGGKDRQSLLSFAGLSHECVLLTARTRKPTWNLFLYLSLTATQRWTANKQ